MAKKERKARVLDKNGNIKEINISSLSNSPLIHHSLSKDLIERIGNIYKDIKGIYEMTLEEFEIGFMRDENPKDEVLLWECIVETLNRCMSVLKNDKETKDKVFSILVHASVGALTNEELKRDDIKVIRDLLLKTISEKQDEQKGSK
jgi:hypothetical protein